MKIKQYLLVGLLSLLFVMFAPKTSLPQNKPKPNLMPIYEIGLVLVGNSNKLDAIREDLKTVVEIRAKPTMKRDIDMVIFMNNILLTIEQIETIQIIHILETKCDFFSDMIKENSAPSFYSLRKESLIRSKEMINNNLRKIRILYANIENNAVLHLLDKTKEIIHSSLELFDKIINIYKSLENLEK